MNKFIKITQKIVPVFLLVIILASTSGVNAALISTNSESKSKGDALKVSKEVNIVSKTARDAAGDDYEINMFGRIYLQNDKSTKWVLLVHPFMNDGTKIVNAIGSYYYEKGYNILAPDLRAHGKSKKNAKVGMGFVDSLDMYDWLTYLNENYQPSEVFVHGISLGGATVNFLSGIDQFMNNAPIRKLDYSLKSLRELKVVGLTEDCGYTDMTEFQSKEMLLKTQKLGMTEEEFPYYSNAENSLKYCDIPVQIIHGTKDFMVKPKNAETVEKTVKGPVTKWLVEGQQHAFMLMGPKANIKEEYRTHVHNHIDKNTLGDKTEVRPEVPEKPQKPEKPEKPQKPGNGNSDRIIIKIIKRNVKAYIRYLKFISGRLY